MKKILVLIGILAIAGAVYYFYSSKSSHEEGVAQQYTCPMHPQVISDKPGTCPICGMTLVPIPKESGDAHKGHEQSEEVFQISSERRQIIGVRTEKIAKKTLEASMRLPGKVAYDSELYVTEEEYASALQSGAEREILRTIESKLKRLGISERELKEIQKTRKSDKTLFSLSKGESFWIYAVIYEANGSWVNPGMTAHIKIPNNAATLEGVIEGITPVLDPMTRTATARIRVSNPSVFLKPETFVNVTLKKELGEFLSLSQDAVIDTGVRKIVFVDLGDGFLEPREVILGEKAGSHYPILAGLNEGENVILSAQFLLDSEATMQAALKRFGKPSGGHQH